MIDNILKVKCGGCSGKGYIKSPSILCSRCGATGVHLLKGNYDPSSPIAEVFINYSLLPKLKLNSESQQMRSIRVKADVDRKDVIEWAQQVSPDWVPIKSEVEKKLQLKVTRHNRLFKFIEK